MNTIHTSGKLECGVDESGRGSLFGRLYCGACIWPEDLHNDIIKDSKKYTKSGKRDIAYDYVLENCISWGVAYAEPWEIDSLGLSKAWLNTMYKAILSTYICADVILVDGNYFYPMTPQENYNNVDFITIVDGDDKYTSIAAASVIAKVQHDRHIKDIVEQYPELNKYDLLNNKGYGSKSHTDMIKTIGKSKFHRKSFAPHL